MNLLEVFVMRVLTSSCSVPVVVFWTVAWMRIDIEGPFSSEKERRNLMLACMAVFAPLAERAGMKLIQDALQESAFKELMPEEHKRISTQLKEREEYDLAVLRQAQKEVRQVRLQSTAH